MSTSIIRDHSALAYPLWRDPGSLDRSRREPVEFPVAPAFGVGQIAVPTFDLSLGSVQVSFQNPQLAAELAISEFDFVPERGQLFVRAALAPGAALQILVSGSVSQTGTEFHPEKVSLKLEVVGDGAQTHFIASIFTPLLALSAVNLKMPAMGLLIEGLKFDLPLREISETLAGSKTAYKLIVIGKATGTGFDFPPHLTGPELETITFIYRAIVDRSFDWPLSNYPLRVLASKVECRRLTALKLPAAITVTKADVCEELLGQVVCLGDVRLSFKEVLIKGRDAFLKALESGSGQEVETVIKVLDGRARVECPSAPRLPAQVWSPDEQALIAIEPKLCDLLAERYNDLAAATLAGLTEDEKAEITSRPELDEDAHLISDRDQH